MSDRANAGLSGPKYGICRIVRTRGVHAATDVDIGSLGVTARGMLGWRHAFGDTVPTSRSRNPQRLASPMPARSPARHRITASSSTLP
ncbi:hypothetical protein ADU59_15485 [Pararhizobium polonicum]|uniref:Uncharacterized protein n=1 Tax=Pararhizobium polonicum TaxID=1612624 RepID=A0A1C7P001_9HYPH|nr:hypothetical protein ADU59_15485 [Pararhizobium polonicum]